MNGISALLKGTPESSLYLVRIQCENACLQPKRGLPHLNPTRLAT